MEKINYEIFQDIISYFQSGNKNKAEIQSYFQNKGIFDEVAIDSLTSLANGGKKCISAFEKIIKEESALSLDDVIKYSNNIVSFIEHHNFAPPLLVKELPSEFIEDFKQPIWARIN